jgi:hypothetical protein
MVVVFFRSATLALIDGSSHGSLLFRYFKGKIKGKGKETEL